MNATVDIRVHDAEVHALVQQIYQACGMGATDAALMADSHVESDLRGAHSHGVLRVPARRVSSGSMPPANSNSSNAKNSPATASPSTR
jgi:LDH2 family malate/lactate/ureidoglycolate dehydrogenase